MCLFAFKMEWNSVLGHDPKFLLGHDPRLYFEKTSLRRIFELVGFEDII